MKVTVKFEHNGAPSTTIKVRGTGPENLIFEPKVATKAGSTITDTDHECKSKFKNKIDFFDTLNISWEVSLDNGNTWNPAGTTKNQVYVVRGTPRTTLYHTLVHLGCKKAEGLIAEAATISAIWGEFTGCDVKTWDDIQLTYYGSYQTQNYTTADLLANHDGQCGAWARFFMDMLKVQDITKTNNFVIVEPNAASGANGFIVKDWSFVTGPGISGHPTFPYLNIPGSPLTGPSSYNWRSSPEVPEVTDSTGIGGQGTENPASLFGNHQIILIGGTYYDPSYGKTYTGLPDMDNTAINGYFVAGMWPVDEPDVGLDLNNDGDQLDNNVSTLVYLFKKNPVGNDLAIRSGYPTDY